MQNLINNQVKNRSLYIIGNKKTNQSMAHHGGRSKSATSMARRPNSNFEQQDVNKNQIQNIQSGEWDKSDLVRQNAILNKNIKIDPSQSNLREDAPQQA